MRFTRVHIEHELPECALKPRQAFFQHDKTRAGEFGRNLEIHLPERIAEIEVLFRREGISAP